MHKQHLFLAKSDVLETWRCGIFLAWLAWQHFTRKVADYLKVIRCCFVNKDVIVEMLQENRKKLLGPATKYKIPPKLQTNQQ